MSWGDPSIPRLIAAREMLGNTSAAPISRRFSFFIGIFARALFSVFVFSVLNAALICWPRSLHAASTGCGRSQRLIGVTGELAGLHGPSKLFSDFIGWYR